MKGTNHREKSKCPTASNIQFRITKNQCVAYYLIDANAYQFSVTRGLDLSGGQSNTSVGAWGYRTASIQEHRKIGNPQDSSDLGAERE